MVNVKVMLSIGDDAAVDERARRSERNMVVPVVLQLEFRGWKWQDCSDGVKEVRKRVWDTPSRSESTVA
jgi:hypothetical protein